MASKYASLTTHLQQNVSGQWTTLSSRELKKILGFPLPKSAWDHQAWWGNHHGNLQARSWMDAGFAVEAVNLQNGTIRFVRKSGTTTPVVLSRKQPEIAPVARANLTNVNDSPHNLLETNVGTYAQLPTFRH